MMGWRCLTGFAVVLALTSAPPAVGGDLATPPVACAAFASVAVDRIPSKWRSAGDVEFSETWRDWANRYYGRAWPLTPGDEPQFRMTTTVSFLEPLAYEAEGVRLNGRWRVSARSETMFFGWSKWRRIALTSSAAKRLDAAFSDDCLWRSPQFVPDTIPLSNGKFRTSFDGPITFLDVRASGRRWGGIQVSWILGAPGQMRAAIMAGVFHTQDGFDRDLRSALGIERDTDSPD